MNQIEKYIRSIPDFPKKGIIYRDITTLLKDANGFHIAVNAYQEILKKYDFDLVLGLESRGFIFGAPIAYNLNKAFVPVRKKGKLPSETICEEYELEYGTAQIEMHTDAIKKGQRVVIVDDLIATGGTVEATTKLVEKLGGVIVACIFLIELEGLGGREKLKRYPVESIIRYKEF